MKKKLKKNKTNKYPSGENQDFPQIAVMSCLFILVWIIIRISMTEIGGIMLFKDYWKIGH